MKNFVRLILCLALITSVSVLEAGADPGNQECVKEEQLIKAQSAKVALALGGGGVRGAAHIGVLRVLEEEGIPINYIVGNSMGAVVGGLYCAGVPLDKLQQVMSDGTLVSAYLPRFLWCRIMFQPFSDLLHLGRKKPYAGLISGGRLKRIIDQLLPDKNMRVENLNTPFARWSPRMMVLQVHGTT